MLWSASLYRRWGDACGYGRTAVRRQVERGAGLSAAALRRHQEAAIPPLVRHCLRRFPLYAARVREHLGRLPQSDEELAPELLPIWSREDQRQLFEALEGPPLPGAFVHRTGGSTGTPTRFYVSRESYEWRMAVSDRGYSWAGAEEGRRAFFVWGAPATPLPRLRSAREAVHHLLQCRRFFNSFDFSEDRKAECCLRINRFRPQAIVGYAGNLVELARFAASNPGVLRWCAGSVVTAAEGLLPGQRELIERTLGREVFVSYGSREFMLIGMESRSHTGYHLSADNLHVEVVGEDGRGLAPGQTGRILVTDLHNYANPFIRYEIGDVGAMVPEPPGRGDLPFPRLRQVDGRLQEYILLPDGARRTALFVPHLLKEFDWIEGFQIHQSTAAGFQVHLVCASALTPERTGPLLQALRRFTGAAPCIEIRRVPGLARAPSGKHPLVWRTDG